ncbi:MAG: Rieske 2Fe-2S domain-containing protein [Candidatus Eisenbacteria bacterium]|nr:Rieske 2Fe-2S domain-containing protein [Candidatus Eisenbacteria bacterium]MCC7140630.1 Rieske 2Fe-2S domain-containing protein [Candidatus Eisenbacteria bacterium]
MSSLIASDRRESPQALDAAFTPGAPALPEAWYLVGPSAQFAPLSGSGIAGRRWLPNGVGGSRARRPVVAHLFGRPLVLWRDRAQQVVALPGYCAHLGAFLGYGEIVDEKLRCPLHHWCYDRAGHCRDAHDRPMPDHALPSLPVVEALGAVFVGTFSREAAFRVGTDSRIESSTDRPDLSPRFPLSADPGTISSVSAPVRLRTSWLAVAANAFDVRHLESVHGRTVVGRPEVEQTDRSFTLRFQAKVTGSAPYDRLMRRLSGDRVEVAITSYDGPLLEVWSQVGTRRTGLVLSLRPMPDGVEVVPMVRTLCKGARRPPPLASLSHAIARRLYAAFLKRDVELLDQMQFRPRPEGEEDAVLARFLQFARNLPATRPPVAETAAKLDSSRPPGPDGTASPGASSGARPAAELPARS